MKYLLGRPSMFHLSCEQVMSFGIKMHHHVVERGIPIPFSFYCSLEGEERISTENAPKGR